MVRSDGKFTKLTGRMAEAYAGVEGQGEIAFVVDEAAGWQIDLVLDDSGIGAYYSEAEGWDTVGWFFGCRNRRVCRVLGEELARALVFECRSGTAPGAEFLDEVIEAFGLTRL